MRLSVRSSSLPRAGSRLTEDLVEQFRSQGGKHLGVSAHPASPLPMHVLREIERAANLRDLAPSAGDVELREAIAASLEKELRRTVDADEILVTAGAMHALHIIFMGLLDPGDSILTTSPCFFFDGIAGLSNAKMVYHPTSAADGYAWNLQSVDVAPDGIKALLLNSPTNPTGYVCTSSDLQEAAALAEANDWYIISDESYDRFVYDGREHLTPASLPGLSDRTILVRSFTKSYAMPAWRVGYIYASRSLIGHLTRILEWTNLYCNSLAQRAALAAFTGPQDWILKLLGDLQRNRDVIWDAFGHDSRVSFNRPSGGPFVLMALPGVDEAASLDRVAVRLAAKYGIPATSGTAFHAPGRVRIPFGGSLEAAELLANRLDEAIADLFEEVSTA